jgi:hypothetical protein
MKIYHSAPSFFTGLAGSLPGPEIHLSKCGIVDLTSHSASRSFLKRKWCENTFHLQQLGPHVTPKSLENSFNFDHV